VPDTKWWAYAKIDLAEARSPVRRLGWELGAIVGLLLLANFAAGGFVWKTQQAKLYRQGEAWYRAIANDTPAYLWMASPQEENSFISKPFQEFLGVEAQKLSENWTRFIHPDDASEVKAALLTAFTEIRPCAAEFRLRRHDGQYRWVVCKAAPRHSEDGGFLGFAGSIVDIQQEKEAEEKLVQSLAEKTRQEADIRALSASLMGAQEEERARISRELHDDFSQQIAFLSIAMGNLKRLLPGEHVEARSQSDRIQHTLVDLAETVRRISHELHPPVLEHSGLAAAIHSYCQEFEALTNIQVLFESAGDFGAVPPGVSLNLYRIVQEALHNVAKHARVSKAEIQLSASASELRLTISDRGVGIAPRRPGQSMGLGLLSIRERAHLMNGDLDLCSAPDQGTTITITVRLCSGNPALPAPLTTPTASSERTS
jgi:PAS domain S-box-containing protein